MARNISVRIVGDSRSLERAFQRAGRAADKFSRKMGKTAKRGLFGGKGMGGVVRAGAKGGLLGGFGLIGGGAAVITSAISKAATFEQSLNMLQSVSHATNAQLRQMSALAIALGNDMSLPATSASDAAVVMGELAKGGLSVAQTMRAAKGALQLSAAADIDQAEAATITARALNSFGLSGNKAGMVADVLANAANASTGEVTDFAYGLRMSSAVAHQWGLSINQTMAALMELADAGVVGSDAGTSLKTMLSFLIPKSDHAAGVMKKLGVDVFDSAGNFVGFREAIEQYHDALNKLNPEQQKAALYTIFGSDAIRAANILMLKSTRTYDQYVKKTERQGAAADVAAARMKGLKGAIEGFKSILETLAITFGLGFLKPLTGGVGALNKKLSDPKVQKALRQWGIILGQQLHQALVKIGKWFKDHWPQILAGARAFGAAIKAIVPIVRLLAKVVLWALRKVILPVLQALLFGMAGVLAVMAKLPFVGGKFKSALKAVNESREGLRELRGALAPRHPAPKTGGGPLVGGRGTVHLGGNVYLDKKKVGSVMGENQQRSRGRGAKQTRGRNGGNNLAFSH